MEWRKKLLSLGVTKHLVVISRVSQECFIIGQLKRQYGVILKKKKKRELPFPEHLYMSTLGIRYSTGSAN